MLPVEDIKKIIKNVKFIFDRNCAASPSKK